MSNFFIYLIFCVFMFHSIAWGMELPYDPEMENQLKTSYSIVFVPQTKGSQAEVMGPQSNKPIKLSLNLDHPELYDQGNDGACAFFSTICAMLMTEKGKNHLKKMFLGQDDNSVYVKFPSPSPFGITNIDAFLENFKGSWHSGFDKLQYLQKNVFKVSKDIIEDHAPLSALPNTPGWFRLLAAAYFKVTQSFAEADADGEDSDQSDCDVFEYLPTSFYITYFQGEIKETNIDILSGKPLRFNLNLEEAYEKKEFVPISSLIDCSIRNISIGVHGRAMYISNNQVRFFDSLKAKKGIFKSNLFNDSVKREDIENEINENISSLIRDVKSIHEKIKMGDEERKSEEEQDIAEKEKAVTTEDKETTLGKKYEQTCFKIEQALEQRFPLHLSPNLLNIKELSQEDFILRLYAELAKSNMFTLEVLDL